MNSRSVFPILILISILTVIASTTSAQNTWKEADSLRQSYMKLQNFSEAKKYAEKAIHLVEKKVGINDTLYADMTLNLMIVYYYTGKYPEAIECLKIEKDIRKKLQGEMHPLYGECLSNLGLLYKITGRLEEALPIIEESVRLGRSTLNDGNPELGIRIMGLGNMYISLEQYEKALPYLMEAKLILSNAFGEISEYHLNAVSNIAHLYSSNEDFDNALKYSLMTIEIVKKLDGKKNKNYSTYLNNLGELYEKMGAPKKSKPLYNEAVEIAKEKYGENHILYGRILANLGHFNQKFGENKLAESQLLEALKILKANLGKEHILYIIALNNLGYNYIQLNENRNGLNRLMEASKLIQKSTGEYKSRACLIYNNIGNAYENLAKPDSAILYFNKGLAISDSVKYLRNSSSLLNYNIAKSYDSKNDFNNAYNAYKKAINSYTKQMEEGFTFMSEKDKEGYFSLMNSQFATFYNFAQKHAKSKPKVSEDAFNLAVRNKGILLKSSSQMRKSILESNDSTLIISYKDWIDTRKKLEKLYSSSELIPDTIINKLEEQALALERDLVRKSLVFADNNADKFLNFKKIKESIGPSEVAIEFIDYKLEHETIYCAFILNKKLDKPKMIKLFTERDLINVIGRFGGNNLNYIQNLYGKKNELNKKLHDFVWAPLIPFTEGAKKLYISPSGLLHKISFSAIKTSEQRYLSDDYQIEMITSSASLTERIGTKFNLSSDTNKDGIAIYGGVIYNSPVSENQIWQYLDGTQSEVNNISNLLKIKKIKFNLYTGLEASEMNFKKGDKMKLIHFATHGFFFPDPTEIQEEVDSQAETKELVFRSASGNISQNENFVKNSNPLMRSGLVLSGANDVWNKEEIKKEEDGMLTALEVSNMNLRNTELVVLSACETGLGEIKGAEGVYGLQRAFKMAGVNFMIMSLWQVPDNETEEFMTHFYSNLVKSKYIRKAFSKTQKNMRKKYDPFYWAAFVLIE